jgi:type II restriction enzyme
MHGIFAQRTAPTGPLCRSERIDSEHPMPLSISTFVSRWKINGPEGKRVVDGAYLTMIRKIRDGSAPSLILLQYDYEPLKGATHWTIRRLVAIHPVFFTESLIEARKVLSPNARRAGWQGCNIRLDRVPDDGRIEIIRNAEPIDTELVRQKYASAQRLAVLDTALRGWTALTLGIVRRLDSPFSLDQVCAKRAFVETAFPGNRHVEANFDSNFRFFVTRDL